MAPCLSLLADTEETEVSGIGGTQRVWSQEGDGGCCLQSAPCPALCQSVSQQAHESVSISILQMRNKLREVEGLCPGLPRCGCTLAPVECDPSFLGLEWQLKSPKMTFSIMQAHFIRMKQHDCIL